MTNTDGILKSRDINLLTQVSIVKTMVFPVVMYGYEHWATKKAEHWRTNVFELWFWRRLLRVPWPARRSNQSALKEINSKYLLEGMMLNLMRRSDSLEKTLMLGKIDSRRRRGKRRMRWLDGTTDMTDTSLSTLWEIAKNRGAWQAAVHEVPKSWKEISDWTATTTTTAFKRKWKSFRQVRLFANPGTIESERWSG